MSTESEPAALPRTSLLKKLRVPGGILLVFSFLAAYAAFIAYSDNAATQHFQLVDATVVSHGKEPNAHYATLEYEWGGETFTRIESSKDRWTIEEEYPVGRSAQYRIDPDDPKDARWAWKRDPVPMMVTSAASFVGGILLLLAGARGRE